MLLVRIVNEVRVLIAKAQGFLMKIPKKGIFQCIYRKKHSQKSTVNLGSNCPPTGMSITCQGSMLLVRIVNGVRVLIAKAQGVISQSKNFSKNSKKSV